MIEVLKQAYQLLLTEPHAPTVCDQLEIILRQAIADLESQEPVAWLWKHINRYGEELNAGLSFEKVQPTNNTFWMNPNDPRLTATEVNPLYTHPPQRTWQGLTDEEIIDVIHPLVMADMSDQATDYEIAKAIEAKLKEKNT